jgi:hypothetical protein
MNANKVEKITQRLIGRLSSSDRGPGNELISSRFGSLPAFQAKVREASFRSQHIRIPGHEEFLATLYSRFGIDDNELPAEFEGFSYEQQGRFLSCYLLVRELTKDTKAALSISYEHVFATDPCAYIERLICYPQIRIGTLRQWALEFGSPLPPTVTEHTAGALKVI